MLITRFIKKLWELENPQIEILVPYVDMNQYQNSFFDFKNLTNSLVVNISTNDCSLKCRSFDQMGHLSIANDKAKYSVSSLSETSEFACLRNISYLERGKGLILVFNLSNKEFNSFEESFDRNLISDLCSSTSLNKVSGQYNSTNSENAQKSKIFGILKIFDFHEIISFVTPLPINPVNTTVASITNSIHNSSGYNFFNFLCMPAFTFLANSSASFSVSLDLDTIDLNNLYSFISFEMAFLAISDQFISGNDSILDLSSLGIANVSVGIFNPPLAVNASNYVYYPQVYKSFAKKYIKQKTMDVLGNRVSCTIQTSLEVRKYVRNN